MKNFDPNPRLQHASAVARRVVAAYPDTFEDRTDDGECLGNGYYSLAQKKKTRIEHVNRGYGMVRIRKNRKKPHANSGDSNSDNDMMPQHRRPSDKYGCIAWQPHELPDGETGESLIDKKLKMISIFHHHGPAPRNVREVDELMTVTYILQRRSINCDPPPVLSALQDEWPYLFTARWMCQHFDELVGVPIISTMREAVDKKGRRILRFMEECVAVKVKDVLHQYHELTHLLDADRDLLSPTVVLLLMAYLKENVSSLFLTVDVSNAIRVRVPTHKVPRVFQFHKK